MFCMLCKYLSVLCLSLFDLSHVIISLILVFYCIIRCIIIDSFIICYLLYLLLNFEQNVLVEKTSIISIRLSCWSLYV